jgi:hypothetical protein
VRRWLSRNRSSLTFLLLTAAGLAFHFYPEGWWLQTTIHALSDALMVAGLLGLTVDRFLKHDLMRDVGSIFIGWALPDEIRNYIREVSRTSLVRRNYRAEYDFKKSEGGLLVVATESWEVFNYSSGSRRYESHMAINLVEKPSLKHMQCEFTQDGHTRVYTADELNKKYCKTEKTRVIYRIPKKSLRWQDIEDRRTVAACRVKWHYRITKNLHDFILTYSTLPTINLTICVRSDCGLRFEFDQDMEHAEGSLEWRFPSLLMPQQQLSMRWYPESNAITSPTPPFPPSAGNDATGRIQP